MAAPQVSHKQAAVLSGPKPAEKQGSRSAIEILRQEAEKQGFLGAEGAPLDLTTKAGQVRYVCGRLKSAESSDRDTIGFLKHLADLAGISGARGDLRRESDEEVVEELLALSPIIEMAFKIRLTDKGPVQKPRRGRPPKPKFADTPPEGSWRQRPKEEEAEVTS